MFPDDITSRVEHPIIWIVLVKDCVQMLLLIWMVVEAYGAYAARNADISASVVRGWDIIGVCYH